MNCANDPADSLLLGPLSYSSNACNSNCVITKSKGTESNKATLS